ncbi:MAG: hypothetical protein QUS33_08430 [Dehalococcoidia bacterium]|nr:hypothetical protein [Dehalococcoidia bacterium]
MSGQVYGDRLICYLDIMGLKNRIKASETDQRQAVRVKATLEMLSQSVEEAQRLLKELQPADYQEKAPEVTYQMFSDTVVLCADRIDGTSLLYLLYAIGLIQARLTIRRTFLRGAVTVGKHYQEQERRLNVMFGPAFTQAYEVAETLAGWPRVLIHPEVLQGPIGRSRRRYIEQNLCVTASDGLPFVDYLGGIYGLGLAISWRREYLRGPSQARARYLPPELQTDRYVLQHKKAIEHEARLKGTRDDIAILVKYHSAASYHNGFVDSVCEFIAHSPQLERLEIGARNFGAVELTLRTLRDGSERDVLRFLNRKLHAMSQKIEAIRASRIDLEGTFPGRYAAGLPKADLRYGAS